MKTCAIVLAAGRSERFGQDKLWLDLGGRPVWLHSYSTLAAHPEIQGVGVVCQPGRRADFTAKATGNLFVVEGGASRRDSSLLGVEAVPPDFDAVLLHDAARPFLSPELVSRVVAGVIDHGAAFPAMPVTDTIKQRVGDRWSTLDRSLLSAVQTPQGSRRDWLLEALRASGDATDDASLLEQAGRPVVAVQGDPRNIKLTHPDDLGRQVAMREQRTGFGYDIHAFSADPNRKLILGGVEFPGERGLEGHSDADVLLHAIVDAVLGAAALGDIGDAYPNTDATWKGQASGLFLAQSCSRIRELGYELVNIDATVLAERPKLGPRRSEICATIAGLCGIDTSRVSVKATTCEGLGAIGRGEGIVAQAVAVLSRLEN